jgi:CO/xanthine dehydrogenase Mo-binding subunit
MPRGCTAGIPLISDCLVQRGAGWLGSEVMMVRVPGAIVNAVYNATGKRITDLPITIEKLL